MRVKTNNQRIEELEKGLLATGIGSSKTQVLKNADLNSIDIDGFYYISSCNIGGTSFDDGYLLQLTVSSNYKLQAYVYSSLSNTNLPKYRKKVGGTWYDWKNFDERIITTDTEFETGRIIDGKKEYGKTINLGTLANADKSSFKTGLSASNTIKSYQFFAKNRQNQQLLTVPFLALNGTNYISAYFNDNQNIIARTNWDATNYDLILNVYYTKN